MMRRLSIVVAAIGVGAVPALAFQPTGGQSEFVPVNSLPPAEQLAAAPLLVAAYAFVWFALMIYLWSIWRRLTKVETDMRALEERQSRRHNLR